jgi:Kef-type K+ transport system membrane component KefB
MFMQNYMIFLLEFTLPLKDPILIFSLVLFIILFAPILLRKIHVPSIIGLIVAGVVFGPHGLNVLERDSSIVLFGTVGLLYIMFLAGLEIDLADFKKNKNRSIIFGILTFSIPIGLGTVVSYYFLNLEIASSVLLASMFASHTLLAYPITSRLGINKSQVVNITVGGTMITDTAALLVLAVIAGSVNGEITSEFWIRLVVSLAIFSFIVFYGIPRIGRWFFKNIETGGSSQYIFVLAIVFTCAFLAELAGVESIIGAFMAGLALNKLIPHTSPLMNRVEFVGNTLFIPFFLLGVGMLVDLTVIFTSLEAITVAVTMTVLAMAGKWIAAFLTQKLFSYSRLERNIIFGLSNAQAAATLAVVIVGFDLGFFDETILNGTILMILVTCLVSSFVVENAGRKLAIIESDKKPDVSESPDRILVPIANPNTIEPLIDLALMIKEAGPEQPIYPLSVVRDDHDAKENLMVNQKMLEKAITHASATENTVQLVSRVDLNIASGILRAIKELMITKVVMGWNGKITARERIFGSVLDSMLLNTEQMILVSKIIGPLNTIKNIIIVVPPNAELEIGFQRWVRTMKTLAKQTGAKLVFYSPIEVIPKLEVIIESLKPATPAVYKVFEDWEDFLILAREVGQDDLLVVVSARKGTISYNSHLDDIPKVLSRHFAENSFVILYPEQNPYIYYDSSIELAAISTSPIRRHINRIVRLKQTLKDMLKSKK